MFDCNGNSLIVPWTLPQDNTSIMPANELSALNNWESLVVIFVLETEIKHKHKQSTKWFESLQ